MTERDFTLIVIIGILLIITSLFAQSNDIQQPSPDNLAIKSPKRGQWRKATAEDTKINNEPISRVI